MQVAAIGRQREREIASFDDGELWCDDTALPPTNPAGWYFRDRRGAPATWIGPFSDPDDARSAPSTGDALRDARRYLELWRRGEPVPCPRPALTIVAPIDEPSSPAGAAGELALDGGQGMSPGRGAKASTRRAADVRQLTFGF